MENGFRGSRVSIYYAVHTFFQSHLAEVNYQSQTNVCQSQIGIQLLQMDGGYLLHRFQFNDEMAVHNHIDAVGTLDSNPFEADIDVFFPLDDQTALNQYSAQ